MPSIVPLHHEIFIRNNQIESLIGEGGYNEAECYVLPFHKMLLRDFFGVREKGALMTLARYYRFKDFIADKDPDSSVLHSILKKNNKFRLKIISAIPELDGRRYRWIDFHDADYHHQSQVIEIGATLASRKKDASVFSKMYLTGVKFYYSEIGKRPYDGVVMFDVIDRADAPYQGLAKAERLAEARALHGEYPVEVIDTGADDEVAPKSSGKR